jgi:site-specific DNA-methyltransferase (adenine-specific)
MNNFLNKVICGDAIETLKQIQDNFIDLTVTSPPYGSLRTYKGVIKNNDEFDGYSFPFIPMVEELYRVTKDGGVVVWVIGDQIVDGGESGDSFRQALTFMNKGFKLYDTMIYHKSGPAFPESGRYSQVFEYMFVFSKGKPKTVNLLRDKVNRWAGISTFGTSSSRKKDGEIKSGRQFTVAEYGYRYNCWNISNGAGYTTKDKFAFQHPALFPEELAEDHILSWSNPNDVVCDCMCGGGTTLKMAKMNNRNFIGIDINQEYVDISNKRIEVEPYTEDNPNPKLKFIISREQILANRKKKKKKDE